jgi:hypothetical protein
MAEFVLDMLSCLLVPRCWCVAMSSGDLDVGTNWAIIRVFRDYVQQEFTDQSSVGGPATVDIVGAVCRLKVCLG